jgi:hypothetical protein
MKWMRLICSGLVCIGCVSMLMTQSADARRKSKKKREQPVEVLVESAIALVTGTHVGRVVQSRPFLRELGRPVRSLDGSRVIGDALLAADLARTGD